jgi:hypothetical protein
MMFLYALKSKKPLKRFTITYEGLDPGCSLVAELLCRIRRKVLSRVGSTVARCGIAAVYSLSQPYPAPSPHTRQKIHKK